MYQLYCHLNCGLIITIDFFNLLKFNLIRNINKINKDKRIVIEIVDKK